jgi:hypothetical protein
MKKDVQKKVLSVLRSGRRLTLTQINELVGTADAGKCISRLREKKWDIRSRRGYDGRNRYWIPMPELELDIHSCVTEKVGDVATRFLGKMLKGWRNGR